MERVTQLKLHFMFLCSVRKNNNYVLYDFTKISLCISCRTYYCNTIYDIPWNWV